MEGLKGFLKFAQQLGSLSGQKILDLFESAEMLSRDNSIKTRFDRLSDRLIISQIKMQYPGHSILTEETGWIKNNPDYLWIIDPIDGTGNFINHNPLFAVSIALWIKGEPAIGVIEAPYLSERYLAVKGQGAWKINTKTGKKSPLHVSEVKDLKEAYLIFCTGHNVSQAKGLKLINQLYPKVKRLRQLGSAGIELAWVASGRAEAFILPGSFIWDIAAGILIIQEAGGRVFDFSGKKLDYRKILKQKNIDLVTANAVLKLPKKIKY